MMLDHAERAQTILKDLVEYTKLPQQVVIERCKYSIWELAYEWHTKKTDTLDYYRKTDLYMYDLTKYQSQMVQAVNYMVDQAKDLKFSQVLDLGGGIGEYSIRMAQENKIQITYLDLEGSKTLQYAKWRFKKHSVNPTVVYENHEWWKQEWDAVVAMDVVEHMSEDLAKLTLNRLNEGVRYLYINPEQLQYTEAYPQHIFKFTMDDLSNFEKVDLNLYRNKKLCQSA